MITAEEFLKNSKNLNYFSLKAPNPLLDIMPFIEADLIEFTKMHVEKALEEASKKADEHAKYVGMHLAEYDGLLDSILESYPLENIK